MSIGAGGVLSLTLCFWACVWVLRRVPSSLSDSVVPVAALASAILGLPMISAHAAWLIGLKQWVRAEEVERAGLMAETAAAGRDPVVVAIIAVGVLGGAWLFARVHWPPAAAKRRIGPWFGATALLIPSLGSLGMLIAYYMVFAAATTPLVAMRSGVIAGVRLLVAGLLCGAVAVALSGLVGCVRGVRTWVVHRQTIH